MKKKEAGKLLKDWDFLPPKEIDDPEDKKPEDWEEDEEIDDPEDKKPDDWKDEPETIPDESAKKPEDWNGNLYKKFYINCSKIWKTKDDDDGDWIAPLVPNPKFKGPWEPKKIKNPKYKGQWKPKKIPNPEYKDEDPDKVANYVTNYIGIDLWQVKSGTIFDDILITDDIDYAKEFSKNNYEAKKEKEKTAKDAFDKEEDEKNKKDKPADKDKNVTDDPKDSKDGTPDSKDEETFDDFKDKDDDEEKDEL